MAIQRAETLASNPEPSAVPGPQQRLFTVDEYYKMAEVGILRPDEKVQLIEGKIIEMPAIGARNAYNVNRLFILFFQRLGHVATIRSQIPVRVANRGEPVPDVAAVRTDPTNPKLYESRHPTPEETYLVVEVSDSTLAFDLGEKARMYALRGIRDLWVIDLQGDIVVVHRAPTADGYERVVTMNRGEAIALLDFPDVTFTIDEILG